MSGSYLSLPVFNLKKQKQIKKGEQGHGKVPATENMKCKMNVNVEVKENSNVKANATVCFEDSFKVEGIRLIEGKNGLFMSMPSYRSNSEGAFKNICSPNKEIGKEMQENLIEAYGMALESALEKNGSGRAAVAFGTSEPLKVSGVRVSLLQDRENLKGLATVTLNDGFYVNNIRIFEKEGKEFISLPSYKTAPSTEKGGKDEYKDLCYPVTAEFRKELIDNIKKEYRQQKEQKEQRIAGEGEWLPIPEGAELPIPVPEAEKNKNTHKPQAR